MMLAPQKKSILIFLLVLVLSLLTVLPILAEPIEGLDFTIKVDPATFTKPGEATVFVRLANAGAQDILTPLSLYGPDNKLVTKFFDGGSLSQLKAGDLRTWNGKFIVTQAQLDAGKTVFTLKYTAADQNNAVVNATKKAEARLTYTGETVDLDVKRTITPEVIRKDDTVTVQYELSNNGNVTLTDIAVKEHGSISHSSEKLKKLEPGTTATLKFVKKSGGRALTSHPLISYKKAGDKKTLTKKLDLKEVPLAKPNLLLSLTADQTAVNAGDRVKLTLKMENKGNISYSNVNVTDKKLGEVFTNLSIPAGETVTREKEITLMETATFKFNLSMQDNTGNKLVEGTNELKVSAYDPSELLRLSLTLSSDKDSIQSQPDEAHFYLTVTNNSNYAAKDIEIRHGGQFIYRIHQLDPGQSTVIDRQFRLSQSGKFQFTAIARDTQKNEQKFLSNELSIGYAPATKAPTKEPVVTVAPVVTYTPVPAGDQLPQGSRNALFILTIASAVLFGAAFLLFLISTVMRARNRIKADAAYDHLNIQQKRDYKDETTYVGEAKEAEKASKEAEEAEAPSAEAAELPHQKYLKEEAPQKEEKPDAPAGHTEDENVESDTVYDVSAYKKAEDTPADKAEADDALPDEDSGYSLVRKEEPKAEPKEPRTRRADRKKK